jgi:DNA-binding MarR family transcriptional regulator
LTCKVFRVPRSSRLQTEIRQKRPFASRGQECVVGLLRTTDLVRRRLAGVIEPHGLTLQQYNVLRILRGAGAEGLPTLEIGARMVEQTPGVTRLIDRLVRKSLCERERGPSDRRQVLCRITPAGLALLGRIDGPILEADRACLGELVPAEVERLIGLLDAVRGHPATPAGPPRMPRPGRRSGA